MPLTTSMWIAQLKKKTWSSLESNTGEPKLIIKWVTIREALTLLKSILRSSMRGFLTWQSIFRMMRSRKNFYSPSKTMLTLSSKSQCLHTLTIFTLNFDSCKSEFKKLSVWIIELTMSWIRWLRMLEYFWILQVIQRSFGFQPLKLLRCSRFSSAMLRSMILPWKCLKTYLRSWPRKLLSFSSPPIRKMMPRFCRITYIRLPIEEWFASITYISRISVMQRNSSRHWFRMK